MENLHEQKQKEQLSLVTQVENGIAQVNSFYSLFNPDNITDIFTAKKAVEVLANMDEKNDLAIAKICEKVKRENLFQNMVNPITRKAYKKFTEWAEIECRLERAQSNNYVLIASLIDNDGNDILPRYYADDKNIKYTATALREILFTIKCDIKDENAKLTEKVRRAKYLAEIGRIRPIYSVKSLKEYIKAFCDLIDSKVLSWYMPLVDIEKAVNENARKQLSAPQAESTPQAESAPQAESITEKIASQAKKCYSAMVECIESAYKEKGEKIGQTLKNYLKGIKEYIDKL